MKKILYRIKKVEMSKKILIYCDALLTVSVITTFVALFLGYAIESVVQLTISVSALSAAAHSFYYWKAKAENLNKYGRVKEIEMEDLNGTEG